MNFMHHIKRLTGMMAVCGLLFFTSVSDSFAQNQLSVRAGTHEEYSRLVFDWPVASDYEVKKTDQGLLLSFNKEASIDLAKINAEDIPNIGTFNVTSDANEPLEISIQIKSQSRYRHFKIGNRVIVDVYNAPGTLAKTPVKRGAVTAAVDTPSEEAPDNEELEEAGQKPLAGVEPHVITLTSTKNIGLTAFEREGFLWMVFDDPGLNIAPTISGPKKDEFPDFEKFELPNGVAYRLPKPADNYLYGEGGGLLWRIVMTPNPRSLTPLKPTVIYDTPPLEAGGMSGGKLQWKMNEPRKIITFLDPLIGDNISVVTVDNTSDFTGSKRQYVELEVLPSIVGMAFVPKADDVTAKIVAGNNVEISRPQGLALSSEKDTAVAILRDDIEKEEANFRAEEKNPKISRIYDFDRWEMGGVRALEKNRQILMRSIGTKQGASKVEDLITLAKLNIGNNRGQEALGLLRVAEQELPGIEENTEFIALRAAANALAKKYDEALKHYLNDSVQAYNETDYWRSYVLAGLEDWRQADEVMPADVEFLSTYPLQIQKPLTLLLAEVALRAGKTSRAEELLMSLEAEFPNMNLSQRSEWKYLNGELERQIGNPDEAIANWQTLIEGKDDYYRAKAGLSLTKLQLEQKKITPTRAIDLLESLRYAWRGDELESLINLRLGEVYIDNKEYLKGLSVLRNAISLSPDSIISREVTEYMTETFRSLFMDGKLDEISPIDAVSVYDEFKELTPVGEEGDVFVQKLAERLVDIDLLGRASDLLQHQVDHRLSGASAARVAIRLAAIQLLDSKPAKALESLNKASTALTRAPASDTAGMTREIRLLKARALSKVNRETEALSILRNMPSDEDVNRLRADIAWNAGQWSQAAIAFDNLIENESISLTRPPNEYEVNLILNRAIALNLAGNRTSLEQLRVKYHDLMAQTEKKRIFDLVTRPRQLGVLASRESVSSLISEVDLFGDFIENYRSAE